MRPHTENFRFLPRQGLRGGSALYPTTAAQELLAGCQMVKGGTAELLYIYTDVEPVTFNRGFYSIDMRFFYRVTLQVCNGTPRCSEAEGLCVFDKRCILFGSEGSAKIFSSDTVIDELDVPGRMRTNLPTAVVEAVDPIVLDARVDDCCKPRCRECSLTEIPAFIARSFAQDLVFDDTNPRRYFVTLGQFTLVRLERETQLLILVYDYCIPTTECSCGGDQEDPCGLFRNVRSPWASSSRRTASRHRTTTPAPAATAPAGRKASLPHRLVRGDFIYDVLGAVSGGSLSFTGERK